MDRRAVLKGMLVGGAVLGTPLTTQALPPPAAPRRGPTTAEPPNRPVASDPAAPWAMVAPLVTGTTVGSGWRVAALSALDRGAVVMTLAHRSGQHAQIHLCRLEGQPRGIAHTAELDLVLMNGGDGRRLTGEGIGRAVKTVALRIAAHERGHAGARTPTALLTHRARLHQFGAREIGA